MKTDSLRKVIFLLPMIFVITTNVFAGTNIRTIVHAGGVYETSGDGESYGVDAIINSDTYGMAVYFGVSINNIKADKVIDSDNKTDMDTAFFFGGVKTTLPISPYLELGKDLGKSFINDVISADLDNTDYYLALGLTTSQKYNLGASIYYKFYLFGYTDGEDKQQREFIDLPGLRVFFRFK